jgi:hypothetical protein
MPVQHRHNFSEARKMHKQVFDFIRRSEKFTIKALIFYEILFASSNKALILYGAKKNSQSRL